MDCKLGYRYSILGMERDFPLHHRVQTLSGVHAVSSPVRTGGYFFGVNRLVREADGSPSFAEIKYSWSHNFIPSYVFIPWGLFEHSDNIVFFVFFDNSCLLLPSTWTCNCQYEGVWSLARSFHCFWMSTVGENAPLSENYWKEVICLLSMHYLTGS
jgi:hypothetical protein